MKRFCFGEHKNKLLAAFFLLSTICPVPLWAQEDIAPQDSLTQTTDTTKTKQNFIKPVPKIVIIIIAPILNTEFRLRNPRVVCGRLRLLPTEKKTPANRQASLDHPYTICLIVLYAK